jgi:hypothetical protein
MKIIISGGTGLIGGVLIPELLSANHDIYILGRDSEKIKKIFENTVTAVSWKELHTLNPNEFDIIINLAGENIAAHRWSSDMKNKLLASRVNATQKLVNWATNATTKIPHLYNASAVGIYGLHNEVPNEQEALTEQNKIPDTLESGFASQLVAQWEQTALQGVKANMPVTLMRFAVVLKRGEGMLKKLELPAQFGLGAVIGTGDQPLSWIDHADLVNAIIFLINHPEITGPVNLVAPQLVSQKAFTQILAQVLKKPAFLHLPAWFVRLLFGQMGEELLLSGQAVVPQRLLENQFNFKYPTLLAALTKEFQRSN